MPVINENEKAIMHFKFTKFDNIPINYVYNQLKINFLLKENNGNCIDCNKCINNNFIEQNLNEKCEKYIINNINNIKTFNSINFINNKNNIYNNVNKSKINCDSNCKKNCDNKFEKDIGAINININLSINIFEIIKIFFQATEIYTQFNIFWTAEIEKDVIIVNNYKMFLIMFVYYNEFKAILKNSICLIGDGFIKLKSKKISEQKEIEFEFLEIYNKISEIKLKEKIQFKNNSKVIQILSEKQTVLIGQIDEISKMIELNNSINKENCIENFFYNKKNEVTHDQKKNLPYIGDLISSCEFEVDLETSGFLCGKKFGKTNKITKITGCDIETTVMEIKTYFRMK